MLYNFHDHYAIFQHTENYILHNNIPPKKGGWVPWFCRENPLEDLWQVPHSVEAWGAKSQIWLYKMGTPNPPRSFLPIDPIEHGGFFHGFVLMFTRG